MVNSTFRRLWATVPATLVADWSQNTLDNVRVPFNNVPAGSKIQLAIIHGNVQTKITFPFQPWEYKHSRNSVARVLPAIWNCGDRSSDNSTETRR